MQKPKMWIKLGIHKTTKHSQLKGGKRRAGTFLPAIKEVPRIKLQSWRERLRTTGRPAFGGQNLRSSRAWSQGRLTAPEQIVKARDRKSRLSIMPSCRCCETKLIHIRKRNKKKSNPDSGSYLSLDNFLLSFSNIRFQQPYIFF